MHHSESPNTVKKKAALAAELRDAQAKVAELQEYFNRERKHRAVLQTVRSLASSELDNLNNNSDDDVVFERERTLEERNKEGFANAIVLSSDDEDGAVVPPTKKAKTAAAVVEV
mgnify:CR=1 FL=1